MPAPVLVSAPVPLLSLITPLRVVVPEVSTRMVPPPEESVMFLLEVVKALVVCKMAVVLEIVI